VGVGQGASGSTWALKEWAALGRLLVAGRTRVLLRKGGIHEKDFGLPGRAFLLWPTYLHQHADGLRPEYRDAAEAAMAEPHRDDLIRVRAACQVLDVLPVPDADAAARLRPFHAYTDEQVAMRLAFRPKKVLTALVVQPFEVTPPLEVAFDPAWAGCKSWAEFPVGWPAATAVGDPFEAEATARAVRAALGQPTPAATRPG
jgi:hypothetical protein